MPHFRRLITALFVLALAVPQAAGAGVLPVRDLGRLNDRKPVRIGVLMRYRHQDDLAALIRMQGDRRSRYFHHYLTNAQWNAYYAADAATYARTVALLERRGFHIDRLYANRSMIRATAPAALAERYFKTQFRAVAQRGYGLRYRNARPAVVPEELTSVAFGVTGFDATVHVVEPHAFAQRRRKLAFRTPGAQRPPERARAAPGAVSTSTPGPNPSPDPTLSPTFTAEEDYVANAGYGPYVWATEYDFPVQHGYGGSAQAIGSVIDADFTNSDAAQEIQLYAIPRTGSAYRVYTDGAFNASGGGGVGEATLDAEIAETLAPAADYYEYLTQYFDALGIEGAYAQIVSDDAVGVVNSSFGACETDDPSFEYSTNYLAMQGAAKGITFVAAAGDTGSLGCGHYSGSGSYSTETGVEVPCADDYFVCLGGTEFQVVTSANQYTSEMSWTYGGGGVSVLEALPDWQGQTKNVIATGRNVPDLAFTADFEPPGVGFVNVIGGTVAGSGGTSVASPMFVALQTEINQVQGSRNGFVNARLYDVGNAAPTFAFRDITIGSNHGYEAGIGYDNTTGFGSPLGFELAGAE